MAAATSCRPIVLLLAAAVGCLLSGCGEKLTEYTDDKGGFRILLPGTPRAVKQKEMPGARAVRLQQHSGAYEVAWLDLDAKTLKQPADETLEAHCKMAVEALKGKVLRRKEITQGGHPGRELLVEGPDGQPTVRLRLYLVGPRLYQVTVGGSKWWVEQSRADMVLGSFELLK
jgi:hypothetical protein